MGRFVPALISLDGDEKYVVYDTADGMRKVSRVVSSDSELPSVDASDNGKLLGVDDGEWSVVSAPSGGGNMIIHVSTNEAQTAYVLDKTWNEIKTAFEAGISPVLIYTNSSESGYEGYYYTLMSIGSGYDEDVGAIVYGVNFVYLLADDQQSVAGLVYSLATDSADGYPQSEITG